MIADTGKISDTDEKSAKDARAAIRERETKLRNAAAALATDPLFADLQPPHLRRADSHMAEAVNSLEKAESKSTAAIAAEDKALGPLRDELTRLDERAAETERTIAEAEFHRRAGDQAKNRGTAESLEATSARLGDVGVALRKDLIRASASMRTAEQSTGEDHRRSRGR